MNVTATILYPTPPPTSNLLDHHQRARLVRSARKLGNVLGSTPRLVEPESPITPIPITLLPIGPTSRPSTPKSLRRHGSIFSATSSSRPCTPNSLYTSSSNSSAASLALPTTRTSSESLPEPKSFSTKPRRSKELPRPLVLRLNAVPMALSDPRLPATPSTAPITPTTPVPPTATETRRKRMAKLKRTLGENIPFDLVFPSPSSKTRPPSSPARTASPPARQTRRRSMSVDLGQDMLQDRPSSRVWVTGSTKWTGEWNRKDIREVQQQLRSLKVR